jgi:hypothetical protein
LILHRRAELLLSAQAHCNFIYHMPYFTDLR